jgi:hypothetical protein
MGGFEEKVLFGKMNRIKLLLAANVLILTTSSKHFTIIK